MIVVLGSPAVRTREGVVVPGGLAGSIAAAAATAGAPVQIVGRIGDDALGDALMLALARAGIGHAAVLRDAAHPTPEEPPESEDDEEPALDPAPRATLDAADVALGLRYLTDFSILVVVDSLDPAGRQAATDAARFAGARLIVIAQPGSDASPAADDVFEAPPGVGDAVAGLIGRYAAALDSGVPPDDAFQYATGFAGWTRAAAD